MNKKYYTLSELANLYYLAFTSLKNAKEVEKKYNEGDEFIQRFTEYTEAKFKEIRDLVLSLNAFNDVTDYITGIRHDGDKKYCLE